MYVLNDLLEMAAKGILPLFENRITFVFLMIFFIWASIYDLKTATIKNYQNLAFLGVGLVLFILSEYKIIDMGFHLGYQHFIGAVVGFILLFIPGMILNYAFGGDIKFATVLGFWIGPSAILLILSLATLIQLLILLTRILITKNFTFKNSFPFAPAFTVAYLITLAIFWFF